jgi:hypothetical protein
LVLGTESGVDAHDPNPVWERVEKEDDAVPATDSRYQDVSIIMAGFVLARRNPSSFTMGHQQGIHDDTGKPA